MAIGNVEGLDFWNWNSSRYNFWDLILRDRIINNKIRMGYNFKIFRNPLPSLVSSTPKTTFPDRRCSSRRTSHRPVGSGTIFFFYITKTKSFHRKWPFFHFYWFSKCLVLEALLKNPAFAINIDFSNLHAKIAFPFSLFFLFFFFPHPYHAN